MYLRAVATSGYRSAAAAGCRLSVLQRASPGLTDNAESNGAFTRICWLDRSWHELGRRKWHDEPAVAQQHSGARSGAGVLLGARRDCTVAADRDVVHDRHRGDDGGGLPTPREVPEENLVHRSATRVSTQLGVIHSAHDKLSGTHTPVRSSVSGDAQLVA